MKANDPHKVLFVDLAAAMRARPDFSWALIQSILELSGAFTRLLVEVEGRLLQALKHETNLKILKRAGKNRCWQPPIIKVQVKGGDKISAGDPVVSALYAKVGHGEFGMIVTLGTFTPPAVKFGKSKSNLRLIDGTELLDLVSAHYEHFDSTYKGMLPLRRVHVPEPLSTKE